MSLALISNYCVLYCWLSNKPWPSPGSPLLWCTFVLEKKKCLINLPPFFSPYSLKWHIIADAKILCSLFILLYSLVRDASIYQQINNSHYNKYFIELACSVRIEEYLSCSFFYRFMDLACSSVHKLQKKKNLTNISPIRTSC